jgi:PPOX class probable F420-dependent enzyme
MNRMSLDPQISEFVAARHLGTLATIKRDGRPQLSNISYTYDAETGLVRMSLTGDRAKVKNLQRDSRASMLVQGQDGWVYAVVEGDMELSAITTDPHDEAAEELVDVFRNVAGKEHPDWDEYRAAMIEQKRLVGKLLVSHGYGLPAR